MKKSITADIIACTLATAFIIWLAISVKEVSTCQNTGMALSAWNLIEILF